jgi:5,10-methylenetetrahydrofolate reductase
MNNKPSSFAQKIRNKQKVILYELLPPPSHLSEVDLDTSISLFAKMLKKFPIDGINIPEVREEVRSGARSGTTVVKLEPREVCRYLQKYGINDLIINRPIVYLPWKEQQQWLTETYTKYGIHNFVFVGGESHTVNYPGLPVTEAVKKVTQQFHSQFQDILIGGITIPTRKNEAERVSQKSIAGVEYFTTQILYETGAIKNLLKQYWELCQKEHMIPKTILLSFAPITMVRDIELLDWLGVGIPQETREKLTTGWLGMGWRSMQICQDNLEDILDFVKKNNISVPIGLNVEHVSLHNFETSFDLLAKLSDNYIEPGDKK